MRYIVSDIHGCYKEYRTLLEKIAFSDEDELYVLGDAMDRGAEPIKVIQDMMNRANVFYIIGNHDYMMLSALNKLMVEVTEEKELYEYELEDIIWHRTDYTKRYFQNPDVIVVTGHTPTSLIREDGQPLVYQENGHLALDCACVFGGRLAAYCVETGEVIYVEGAE